MSPKEREGTLLSFLDSDRKRLCGSTNEHVKKILSIVAGMIGCPLPEPTVLAQYIKMLAEYPPDLLDVSTHIVLKTHKWNTFPKIAEFIVPIQKRYSARLEALEATKQAFLNHLGRAAPSDETPPKGGRGFQSLGTSLNKITWSEE